MAKLTPDRHLLIDLIKQTEDECSEIAASTAADLFRGLPNDGVRLFYPDLTRLSASTGSIYANRCTGRGAPTLLQELLLGVPVLVDLYDGVIFDEEYGMTPAQMAEEIKKGRIVPIINASKPLEYSDDYLQQMRPVLNTGAVQLAHFRTSAFQNWYSGGKALDLEREGGKIFDTYFSSASPEEAAPLYKQLRVEKNRDPATIARRTVGGRWRNIVSVYPEVRTWLIKVFDELHGSPAAKKAEILNGVKNIISGPISQGRGGMYRAGPQHQQEMAQLIEVESLSETLRTHLDLEAAYDLASVQIVDLLEKRHVVPVPQHLNYEHYRHLTGKPFWNNFRDDVSRILSSLAQPVPSPAAHLTEWEHVLTQYREAFRSYDRLDSYLVPLLGILAPYPGFALVVVKFLIKIEETIGTKGPLGTPGRMLAQMVWKAECAKWPPKEL